jgi:hypothetical protein
VSIVIVCNVEDGIADPMGVIAVAEVAVGMVMLGIVMSDMLVAVILSVFEKQVVVPVQKNRSLDISRCSCCS